MNFELKEKTNTYVNVKKVTQAYEKSELRPYFKIAVTTS